MEVVWLLLTMFNSSENNAIVTDKTLIILGLKYVHELQQALRLHGLNKIANNIECLFSNTINQA